MKTIRELREEHQWSQLELANRLGVTPGTVSNWERGLFEPRARQLRALAEALGVTMETIDLREGEPQGDHNDRLTPS